MTAPAPLPPEVARIVHELSGGPSHLFAYRQAAITAAFDHGLIEASARAVNQHTLYTLRRRPVTS